VIPTVIRLLDRKHSAAVPTGSATEFDSMTKPKTPVSHTNRPSAERDKVAPETAQPEEYASPMGPLLWIFVPVLVLIFYLILKE
jgi:hypothetical protein